MECGEGYKAYNGFYKVIYIYLKFVEKLAFFFFFFFDPSEYHKDLGPKELFIWILGDENRF